MRIRMLDGNIIATKSVDVHIKGATVYLVTLKYSISILDVELIDVNKVTYGFKGSSFISNGVITHMKYNDLIVKFINDLDASHEQPNEDFINQLKHDLLCSRNIQLCILRKENWIRLNQT